MRGTRALRCFQQGQNGRGELQIDLRCDLDVERRALNKRALLTQCFDELAVVGNAAAEA
jgi:hypothetical protein